YLELGALHTTGACLSHLAALTRLASLHAAGALRLTRGGLAALAALRLPRLESLSLVGLEAGEAAFSGRTDGAAPSRRAA
ncbi:hypothetical protein MNEG_16212, partial [Monoraphidium neglectum]